MIELKFVEQLEETKIFHIFDKGINVGSVELIFQPTGHIYLENIKRNEKYKGNRYLEQVVKYLSKFNKPIGCLPLSKYRSYYEALGFQKYFEVAQTEDIFYVLYPSSPSILSASEQR